ncbi:MAG TPA: (d)CMP kinase [Gemmatimonadaceae bacterium]|nr:(d)CMP kinase [Gemmatimonadaceae bacterium]
MTPDRMSPLQATPEQAPPHHTHPHQASPDQATPGGATTGRATSASPLVVAIDGPAASGKSSTAQWVARELGFLHADSGALYRAATAARLRAGGDADDWSEASVLDAARRLVSVVPGRTTFSCLLDGADAEEELRGEAVTRLVSRVAQMPGVRAWVNARVRELAQTHSIVVDGRDIGTVVFPDAGLKIFLVADSWERARRRLVQRLQRAPTEAEIAEETDRLVHRDAQDATQTVQARDAVLIDTTHLTQPEQVERIVALARAVQRGGGHLSEAGGGGERARP